MKEDVALDGKLAFVGGGAMAEAILKRIVLEELLPLNQIWISDPVAARRSYLVDEYGVETTDSNSEACKDASIVVLAVKPQVFGLITEELLDKIAPRTLLISIMAGVPIATMQDGLGHSKIVRSMPNTPAQVGKGMTVWTATESVTAEEKAKAQIILSAMGDAFSVGQERYIDMTTGLSGSGPGFIFLLIEALIDAGVNIGFHRDQSQRMVLQTIEGCVELMRQSGQHPADLRNRVTSPAGTTAAGTLVLEQRAVRAALIDAVTAAYERSVALGE